MARRIVHLVVPKLADDRPEEVKNAVVLRRELFSAGACSRCKHKLPSGQQLQSFFDSTRGTVDEDIQRGIITRYFEHLDHCRGHINRLKRIVARHGLTLDDLGFEIWCFDLDAREVVRMDPLPEGTRLDEVLKAYAEIVRQREAG